MNARIIASLLLLAAGCVAPPDASVVIRTSCAPPTPAAGGCVYSSTCVAWLPNLWLDPSYHGGNWLEWTFRVDNLRPDNGAREGGTATATAFITGYKLKFFTAVAALPDVSVDWTTVSVPAAGTAVATVPVIPPSVAALMIAFPFATQVRVEIRATGHYADGSKFESGPFSAVVDVVNGWGAGVIGTCVAPQAPAACPSAGQSNVSACL